MGDLLIGDELKQHKASERAISFFLVCILGLDLFLEPFVSYLLMPWLRAQVSRHIYLSFLVLSTIAHFETRLFLFYDFLCIYMAWATILSR